MDNRFTNNQRKEAGKKSLSLGNGRVVWNENI